jgi:hypothetical protein
VLGSREFTPSFNTIVYQTSTIVPIGQFRFITVVDSLLFDKDQNEANELVGGDVAKEAITAGLLLVSAIIAEGPYSDNHSTETVDTMLEPPVRTAGEDICRRSSLIALTIAAFVVEPDKLTIRSLRSCARETVTFVALVVAT